LQYLTNQASVFTANMYGLYSPYEHFGEELSPNIRTNKSHRYKLLFEQVIAIRMLGTHISGKAAGMLLT